MGAVLLGALLWTPLDGRAQPFPANAAMRQLRFDYGQPGYGPGPYSPYPPDYPPGRPVRPWRRGYPNAQPDAWPGDATYSQGRTVRAPADASWTQYLIKKEDRNFDFKTVARGTRSEHHFVIKNPFVDTVHIAGVSSSCTCTTALVLDGKNEIQTHEKTAVVAHLHTDRFDGFKQATITVTVDRPYVAEFQLNIKGDIRSDLSITPNAVQFGPVKQGSEASRTLTVVYTGPMANWKIVDVRSDNEHLTATIEDVKPAPGSVTTKVKVALDAGTPRGEVHERLFLVSNDPENRREIPIIVRGTVGTTIKVSPETVFLGFLKPGEPSPVKSVSLRGTKPFRITKLLCNNPEVQIDFTPNPESPPRTLYLLPIRYTNPAEGASAPKNGKMQAVVRVETDDPELTPAFNISMEIQKPI